MIAFANAKINLGLYVTARRADGYHNLESIFLPVSLSDVVEAIRTDGNDISFTTQGRPIDGDVESNLCVKAYRLLSRDFELGGVEATMLKNVPIGAGLGGGSSDGAHMLKLLNELFSLNLNSERLCSYAAQLGSDCPFFIRNKPSFVHGRGELLDPIELPKIESHVVIIHPGIHVGTADAYRGIRPTPASFDLRTISRLNIDEWQDVITNDFENVVFSLHPEIASIKSSLLEQGARYCSMSGSGSAVFAFFDTPVDLVGIKPSYFVHWGRII